MTDKACELIDKFKRERGGTIYPEWEFLIQNDPDFFEVYEKMSSLAFDNGKVLSGEIKGLIAMAVLAHRGDVDAVAAHIRRAYKKGLTSRHIVEALEAAFIPGGANTLLRGLTALIKVEQEKAQKEKGGAEK